MRTTNASYDRSGAIIRGHVGSTLSGPVNPQFVQMTNSGGADLPIGTVVVVKNDGTITTTTTAQDTRPTGVCGDTITAGGVGPVQFSGPVDLILVTASVTAGYFAQTSTTAGQADATTTRNGASFGYFTSAGTTPSGYLFGGAGGGTPNAELNIEGGQDVIKAHGNLGATATFDPTDGNVHTGTLNANCTFTLNAPSGTGAATLEFWLTEDGTGGRTVTWPGSVTEQGTHDTTAGTTQRVILQSIDGGTNWIATWVGLGVTSVAVTVPAEFAVSGSPITSSGTIAISKATETANTVWAGPTSGSAAQPTFRALVAADIPSGVGTTDHVHVMDYLVSGDGSTTAFELPAAPWDAYSVAAYVAGSLTEVTLSGTMLTTATFGSAPGSGTNNIRFDIVAAVLGV